MVYVYLILILSAVLYNVYVRNIGLLSLVNVWAILGVVVYCGGAFVYQIIESGYIADQVVAASMLNYILLGLLLSLFAAELVYGRYKGSKIEVVIDYGFINLNYVLFIVFFILLVSCYYLGFSELLYRQVYETGVNIQVKSLRALVELMTSVSPVILGYLYVKSSNRLFTSAVVFVLFLYVLYYLGLTTRFVALVPLLFYFGYSIGGGRSKTLLLSCLVMFPFLIYIPLNSRAMGEFGLFPIFNWIVSGMPSQFGNGYDSIDRRMLRNFFHGYLVTYEVIMDWPDIPNRYFWVSVNPLPGSMVGWYDVAQHLRVNMYVPYNMFGQLISHGWFLYFSSMFAVGSGLAFLDKTIGSERVGTVLKVMIFLFGLMFILLSFQYNLRSSVRFFYLALILASVALVYNKLRFKF